ncbi:MAG: diguanylate cyclase domain-containing protein [Thermoleophilaceae bacterium]
MVFERWEGMLRPLHGERPSLQLQLPPDEDAPAAARKALLQVANGSDPEAVADAQVLVSELVTNAVLHGGGVDIDVGFWLSAAGILDVVVADGGPGFVPGERDTDKARHGGMGLELVDTLADRWGSSPKPPGVVWFQMTIAGETTEAQDAAGAAADLLDVRLLLDSVTQYALVALDLGGRVTWSTRAAQVMTGFEAEELLGKPWAELYAPVSDRAVARQMTQAKAGRGGRSERWLRRKDGTVFWGSTAFAPIGSARVRGFSVVLSDQTTRWQHEEDRNGLIAELRELSLTDELTRLPNRRAWSQQLDRELARARRHHSPLAVAMLDLNGFKAFNDENGHVRGDELLRTLAKSWLEPLRATDMLARYGGDEFVVTLPDCAPAEAFTVITRMQETTPRQVSSAAGIAATDGFDSSEDIVTRADAALYEAKRRSSKAVLATSD